MIFRPMKIITLSLTALASASVFGQSVALQATTPGTPQTGHANVTGTINAGHLRTTGLIFGNGSQIFGMLAGNISSGTLADARLSTNVPLKNTTNLYTGINQFLGGFTYVGTRSTPLGGGEILGLGSNNFWAGMYVSSATGGSPYYGYSNGTYASYTHLDGSGFFRHIHNTIQAYAIDRYGKIAVGHSAPAARVDIREDNRGVIPAAIVSNGTIDPFVDQYERFGLMVSAAGSGRPVAIRGWARANWGIDGDSYGVQGIADDPIGYNFGVYGYAPETSTWGTNNSGYFAGAPLYADTVSAGIKNFMIDHPLDPANKVLLHSSIESDERMNLYRGVLVTDARGYATVSVPAWFSALNEDIQYQLTVIDGADSSAFVLAKVVQEMQGGKFKIRTSAGKTKVNWQVSGRRHDPTSNYTPMEVERLKSPRNRGKYYAPGAYGKDPSFGIGHVPVRVGEQRGVESGR